MRCVDETLVFDFLQRYHGYTITIDEVIHLIVKSLGSDLLPAYTISLDENNISDRKHHTKLDSHHNNNNNNTDDKMGQYSNQLNHKNWLEEYKDIVKQNEKSPTNRKLHSASHISVSEPRIHPRLISSSQNRRQNSKSPSQIGSRGGRYETTTTTTTPTPTKKILFPWQAYDNNNNNNNNSHQPIITLGANGSSSNNKKEERDIEIATAWLSSVNKKLAHDDLYTATAKSTSNNNNILTKPSLKPNNLIENNNTNNNNTNIIKLETTIKDDVEEIDESFFITDHREVTRLIDNQAKNMTNKLLNKKKNKSISKDVLNTNNTNNNTATVSDIQLVKSNKSSSKNRDNKKKHIAVLPTVPKIIITVTYY